ncbi:uncharacterized protein LOC103721024 [Phoenix dactylifera]|uniref:Uncharacterized protein LOC103721024 n=1 Tax=Phoenix dactylifera TaxID=42345 RepID=A0A8B7CYN2_PHODC|nr:uncharacterized protein LOC103721024 [Phoenix dactylifera]
MSSSLPSPLGDAAIAEEDDDAFAGLIEYARSMLSSEDDDSDAGGGEGDLPAPPWSWVVSRILKTCVAYPSGVTSAILLSDLFQAWSDQHRYATSKKKLDCMIPLKKRQRRTRLPNTVTIDSVCEKNFLSPSSVLEAVVVDAFVLPGTDIYMLSLGDMWSSCIIDLYLHRRFYHLVDPHIGILKKGREVLLTGCCLRTAMEGSGKPRLLPTEHLVILLDEDQDEDAMLLGAQFCSDSFSSISLDAVREGASYSFYARIESIGSLEISAHILRKQITLVDNDGIHIKFLLWGEQVRLANLFSIGSMLALDKPFIANFVENVYETSEELCLEYGSATQIYVVPFIQHEEQVLLSSTQMRSQGSRLLSALGQCQESRLSQVTLPLNSQGLIDFSNYPLRTYVIDLHDKMSGISLYGVIMKLTRQVNASEVIFSVTIEDITGKIVAKLHFIRSWSLGNLGLGHTIYISGLTCSMTTREQLEVSWFEKDEGASLVNISSLPALLNSSCLHKLSYISNISNKINTTHICRVHLDRIEHHNVCSRKSHVACGRLVNERSDELVECSFCCCSCNNEYVQSFLLKVTLVDESGKIFAWCTGQTSAELLQISADEFVALPEDEQAMYLYTLEHERYMVAIVNCKMCSDGSSAALDQANIPSWEIVRAQKCE